MLHAPDVETSMQMATSERHASKPLPAPKQRSHIVRESWARRLLLKLLNSRRKIIRTNKSSALWDGSSVLSGMICEIKSTGGGSKPHGNSMSASPVPCSEQRGRFVSNTLVETVFFVRVSVQQFDRKPCLAHVQHLISPSRVIAADLFSHRNVQQGQHRSVA